MLYRGVPSVPAHFLPLKPSGDVFLIIAREGSVGPEFPRVGRNEESLAFILRHPGSDRKGRARRQEEEAGANPRLRTEVPQPNRRRVTVDVAKADISLEHIVEH